MMDFEDYFFYGLISLLCLSLVATLGLGIGSVIHSVNLQKQPITVTKATENCVIVEQGGYKSFHCSNMVNVDSFNSDYMRE